MIIFKDLRISPDGKTLFIGAAVPEYSYLDDCYIDGLELTVGEYSSSSRVKIYSSSDEEDDETRKEVWIAVDADEMKDSSGDYLSSFDNALVFVYATLGGAPTSDTQCGIDTTESIGVTYSKRLIYRKALQYMRKSVACGSVVTKEFIDFYLKWKQLELALATGNYALAAEKFAKNFTLDESTVQSISSCGCGR